MAMQVTKLKLDRVILPLALVTLGLLHSATSFAGAVTGVWGSLRDGSAGDTYFDMVIGFDGQDPVTGTVFFNNLSFGFTTLLNGDLVASDSWPKGTTRYVSSDQPWVQSVRVSGLKLGTTYENRLWAIDSGNLFEYSFFVTTNSYDDGVTVPEGEGLLYLFLALGIGYLVLAKKKACPAAPEPVA